MTKSMAVLGAGAIGSSIGADLTKAGYDVVLVDQWPAHVEAMKASGLHVAMRKEEFQVPVRALHLCEVCTLRQPLDIVFLTAKSYDSSWMAYFIKPYLKPEGVLVSAQNSLNDEWLAPIIGYERDIGCALELSAEIFEPGRVKRNTDRATTKFVLGELHGRITPRLQEVAQALGVVGKTETTTNIWGAKWTKLVINTMVMALDTIAGIRVWELAQNPKYLGLCLKMGQETVLVGKALGYTLEPIFGLTAQDMAGSTEGWLKKILAILVSDVGKEARSTVLQDILKGRPSEVVNHLNGLVVKKGREAKVTTPVNEAVTAVMRQVEEGTLKPSLSNMKLLEAYM